MFFPLQQNICKERFSFCFLTDTNKNISEVLQIIPLISMRDKTEIFQRGKKFILEKNYLQGLVFSKKMFSFY